MARALRIEFEGALYHVMARGNETILEEFDKASVSTEVPKILRPARSLEQIARTAADQDQAIIEAYRAGAYTLTEIARHFGIQQSTASRIAGQEGNA